MASYKLSERVVPRSAETINKLVHLKLNAKAEERMAGGR